MDDVLLYMGVVLDEKGNIELNVMVCLMLCKQKSQ